METPPSTSRLHCFLVMSALVASACTSGGAGRELLPGAAAFADLRDAQGKSVGRAAFAPVADDRVRIVARFTGLGAAGPRAIHVHEAGRCDDAGFEAAGSHFNPDQRPHGAHAGDLPNLEVASDGSARLDTEIAAPLAEGPRALLGPSGAALIVHANADDLRTQPAGASGARVACGEIKVSSR